MLTLGIVGVGAAVREIWAPALATLPLSVSALCDPAPAARAAGRELFPGATPHEALDDLLSSPPDWLLVASPPDHHGAQVRAGLQAGCHLLCEKPFVRTADEARQLAALARSARRQIAVNHEFAHMPVFAETLARLQRGEDGPLRFAQLWQNVNDAGATGWRAGGETLREFGTHAIDLLLRAFGGAPSKVTARLPRLAGRSGDSLDLVTLEWRDGRAAQLVLNRLSPGEHRYLEGRFDCAQRSLRVSIGGRLSARVALDPRRRRPAFRLDLAGGGMAWAEVGAKRTIYARNGRSALPDASAVLMAQTLSASERSAPLPCSADDARKVLVVIEAAHRSAATDRSITLG